MIASTKPGKNTFFIFSAIFILIAALAAYTESYSLIVVPFAIVLFYFGWQNRNVVFFLMLVTLPFSFEYQFSPSVGTDIPDELLMLIVTFLFAAGYSYHRDAVTNAMLRHPLMVLLLVSISWLIVSVLFSSNQIVSIKFLLAKGWYIGAFVLAPFIVFREKRNIKTAAITFTASMVVVIIIVLLRHMGNDFSFATVNDAVRPFFRNHVNYSAMLVCSIAILAALFQLSKTKNLKFFIAVLIAVALTALFFSYARGAWLALLTGFMAWGLIKKRWLLHSYIIVLVIAIGLLFWLRTNNHYLKYAHNYKTTIFHKDFNEHLIATYKLKDVSTAERFYRWIAGVRMIKDNWLTGYGPNTFYDNYKSYSVTAFKTWVSDNKEHSTVHNYFLLIAIEQGIPGLVLFLILLGAALWYSQYLYHRVKDKVYKTVAVTTGIMLVMIITVNFLSDLVETDKIGSLFFLCLATLIVTDINSRRIPDEVSDPSPHIEGIS